MLKLQLDILFENSLSQNICPAYENETENCSSLHISDLALQGHVGEMLLYSPVSSPSETGLTGHPEGSWVLVPGAVQRGLLVTGQECTKYLFCLVTRHGQPEFLCDM